MAGTSIGHLNRQFAHDIKTLAINDQWGDASEGVIRIFLLGTSHKFSASHVASIVKVALSEAKKTERQIRSVVLPAGVGGLGVVGATTKGRYLKRSIVEPIAKSWVAEFQKQIGHLSSDVVLGLDGAAERDGWHGAPYSIQTAVLFGADEFHVTFKSLPANSSERTWLVSPSDTAASTLSQHRPVARRGRVMLQVCHDGLFCSGRGKHNSKQGGNSWNVRQALEPTLAKGMVAYNSIHQLPKTSRSRTATSSSFQDSHRVMRERGVSVIAVSGIPRSSKQGDHFRQLSERLACDAPHIDVLIDA